MSKAVFVQKGDILDFTNSGTTDIEYMEVVVVGARIGVAQEPIAKDATGSVSVSGVYQIPADSTTAFAVGDELFWDKTNGKAIKTAGGISAGWAFADKTVAGIDILVKIN